MKGIEQRAVVPGQKNADNMPPEVHTRLHIVIQNLHLLKPIILIPGLNPDDRQLQTGHEDHNHAANHQNNPRGDVYEQLRVGGEGVLVVALLAELKHSIVQNEAEDDHPDLQDVDCVGVCDFVQNPKFFVECNFFLYRCPDFAEL